LNAEVVERVSGLLARFKPIPAPLPSHYLPEPEDAEGSARYIFFMVSIDHRTGRGFSSTIGGVVFEGAELLWKLGELKWRVDRAFFNPQRMAKVSASEVRQWLKAPGGAVIKGPALRAALLRDAARWLVGLWRGSVLELVEEARGSSRKLIELIRPIKAFNDPVAKKAYLLIKLLERARLLKVADREELRIPVDNHVTRVALRLGLIEAPPKPREAPRLGLDVRLRMMAMEAWRAVTVRAGLDPLVLDDLVWTLGRTVCRREVAGCAVEGARPRELVELAPWAWRRCPLEEACRGSKEERWRRLREPLISTWWY